MLSKLGILITILVLVLLFFFVISFGAGAFSKGKVRSETKKSIEAGKTLGKKLKEQSGGDYKK